MTSDQEIELMNRAIALARRAEGQTSPNPMVGAVVVADGEIVGEGYHRKAGRAHAEIEALETAGGRAKGATVYVSLEPCCVQGRTPPCTDALIDAGVASLVYAVRDPNPEVNGQGHRQLEEAGINVRPGVCREEGESLIQAFTKVTREGLPWVTAKFAMSLDGKIATRTGHSRWISSEESRRFSHELRQISDVIVVGAGTVTLDNPRLTTRLDISNPSHPLRVVVDSRGRAPVEAQVYSSSLPGKTVLAATQRVDKGYVEQLESQGVEVWQLPADLNWRVDLVAMLRKIVDEEMQTVLVEGGSGLLGSFFERELVDQAKVSVAPKIIGGVEALSPVGGLGIPVMGDALVFGEMRVETRGVDLWIQAEKPGRKAGREIQSGKPDEKIERAKEAGAEMSSEE